MKIFHHGKIFPYNYLKLVLLLYSRQMKRYMIATNADILHMEALWRYPHILMGIWSKYHTVPIICSPHGMLDPYIISTQGKIKRIISHLFFLEKIIYYVLLEVLLIATHILLK